MQAHVFAVAITCASLIGWVKFTSPSQQRKLFAVVIVQLCVFGVGFFGNLLKFDPIKVQQEILRDYMSARGSSARASDFTGSTFAESKFVGVDLAFVLFDASRFEMARFRHAVFDGADFSAASFKDAVFDGADFSGANLSSIVVDSDTKLPKAAPKSPLK